MTDSIPVLGVDFSGAKADKSTWVTQGVLDGVGLALMSCQAMPRAQLVDLLAALPGRAIAALDFPFSVPRELADRWLPGAEDMPRFWEAAATMAFDGFMDMRDSFVAEHGEPLRRGDLYFPECYSCLHKFNPNMVPMTFRGMQMLDKLWRAGCRVPPLPYDDRPGALLLEAMPGAALRAFGLPFKGYKNGRRSTDLRNTILDGLEASSGVPVTNLAEFRSDCVASHDCLDSVVAAVTACLWAKNQELFRLPLDGPGSVTRRSYASGPHGRDSQSQESQSQEFKENELTTARLEGWLYAPVFLGESTMAST